MEKKQYVKPEIVEIDSKIASAAGNEIESGFSEPKNNIGAI